MSNDFNGRGRLDDDLSDRPIIMSNDQAELLILGRTMEQSPEGRMGLPVDFQFEGPLQAAFNRGLHNGWFKLVDVVMVAEMPDRLCRVFLVTDEGKKRLAQLRILRPNA